MVVDGYVRVSQVRGRRGPSFISPLEQRDQIESWARHHDARVLRVFEELDESGARRDRPLLLEAIARIERGESNGLVVSRLDRFGRSLVDGLAAIERIRLAGGTFVAVQDGFDIRTPTGKLVLRLMLSMAEFELDRIRANNDAARARAIARGAHLGHTPTGYEKRPDGTLAVEAQVAPHIVELFRRRAGGATWRELDAYLRSAGVRTGSGSEFWTPNALYVLVKNRVYRGEVHSGGHRNAHAHEPLIDEVTWQLAQRPNPLRRPNETKPALLTGIVRCASCRGAMSPCPRRNSHGRWHHLYICNKKRAAGPCPAPTSIVSARIDPLVQILFFRALTYPPPEVDYRRRQLRLRRRALEQAEAALAAFRDDQRIEDVLGRDKFVLGLRVRALHVDEARRALAFAEHAAEEPPVPPVAELRRDWLDLTIPERRLYISRVLDCVFVRPGGSRSISAAGRSTAARRPTTCPRPARSRSRTSRSRRRASRAGGTSTSTARPSGTTPRSTPSSARSSAAATNGRCRPTSTPPARARCSTPSTTAVGRSRGPAEWESDRAAGRADRSGPQPRPLCEQRYPLVSARGLR